MNYQALYNKYRPQRFDEVIGQDHVTTTLAREVVDAKVAHAYLFTGPRGTGKTTSARLLAKSLNCPNRASDGEPDNTCPSCIAITEGTSLDVIELDAASHNKVEDIREIRVNVSTVAAAAGARRIYILDEAHMLSRAASNALLKTLEEPPEHVVFVLATTEPYKLLDTIRSRTQRFDFQPVGTETLIAYLAMISAKEGFDYDHAALGAVTSHAGGSVRDAMSLLEQVAALGAGTVSSAGVARALGLADAEAYGRLLGAVHDNDAPSALTLVSELAAQGADLRRFVADAISYLRGVFLTQYTTNIEEVADESTETIEEWKLQATKLTSSEVLRSIDGLSEALTQLREGREERLVVELAVLKLARPETSPDLDSITVRLDRAEREIRELKRGVPSVASPPVVQKPDIPEQPDRPFTTPQNPTRRDTEPTSVDGPKPNDASTTAPQREPDPDQSSADTGPETPVASTDGARQRPSEGDLAFEDFERAWPAIVATIRQDVGPRRHALLREATPFAIEGNTAVFVVAAHMHFHLEQLKTDAGITDAIVAATTDQLGKTIEVSFRSAGNDERPIPEEAETVPDKDDLIEAGDEAATDPADIVLDILGGEIVSDTSGSAT
ncbi:MAG: DNA polymerase III subunit gamma/tau [Actinomycetia bacterium]|nr:DNA polymerase III subunit gamma/tau [Actinomycetes bacterium]